ncbi:MAG: hypothetical protein GEU74_14880 [Nitriliruptorales bacterium]|nr:hypothetical protein [Nitriliruptorales bacterium]
MRRLLFALVMLAGGGALAACAGGAEGSGAATREVQVDYVHDEVASSFIAYFPREVTVRPGDTVVFRQQWTGEPHSVTMGTLVDEAMAVVAPLIEEYGDSGPEPPRKVMRAFDKAMAPLPEMGQDQEDGSFQMSQNAGQPCYLDSGGPPEDPDAPCADADKDQPAFNGRQSYYNSGFIPYEGERGNEFTVELADDIEPGTYNYYCNLHGPFQRGTVNVVEPGADIPSAEDVARQAREEIDEMASPLVAAYERAPREGTGEVWGMTVEAPFAGWGNPKVHGTINEFIPETIEGRVGEPITWSFVGGHTVSFKVPEYFAQVILEEDGTVRISDEAVKPFNVPDPPTPPQGPEEGEGPPEVGEGAPEESEGPPPGEGDGPPGLPLWDVGSWDGEDFISSGLQGGIRFRMTFAKPGTYPYACLLHPQMVGSVKVT